MVINGNLSIFGNLSGVELFKWQSSALTTTSSSDQIIAGNWIIHGNVGFEKNVQSYGCINKVDMRKLADDIEKQSDDIKGLIFNKMVNILIL